jgi:hypothetical protein
MSSAGAARPQLIHWPAIVAGALVAAGVSLTLQAFAAGIGLSAASAAPTWRDSTAWIWVISGIYLVFVSLSAFALGGYIAGRVRLPLGAVTMESEFRDGMNGLVMWGVAVVIAAVMALGVAALAAPTIARGGEAQSSTAENVLASELDLLFRTDRVVTDIGYRRAEAGRILLKTGSRAGIGSADRDYLTNVIATVTRIDPGQAHDRVDYVIAASRDALHKARVAAVLQAFFIAAALLIGAAVSWACAVEGGLDREGGTFPIWDWSWRRQERPHARAV